MTQAAEREGILLGLRDSLDSEEFLDSRGNPWRKTRLQEVCGKKILVKDLSFLLGMPKTC